MQQDIIDEMQLLVSGIHDTFKSVFSAFCSEQNIVSTSAGIGQIIAQDSSLLLVLLCMLMM